jgi:RimJ/RimL family protein N-acetyltransferase
MVAWLPHADPRLDAYNVPPMTARECDVAWERMHDDPAIRQVAGTIAGVCRAHLVLRKHGVAEAGLGIALDGAYVGQGYGRRILLELFGYCRTMEALERLTLEVHAWNERAIRAYTAVGFVMCDRANDILTMEATCAP